MALGIRLGLFRPTLADFEGMDAAESDGLFERLVKAENDRLEADTKRMEWAGKAVDAVIQSIGGQSTAINNLARALGRRKG